LAKRYQHIKIPETVLQEAPALAHREDSQHIAQLAEQHVEVSRDIIQGDTDYLDFGLDAGETQAILLAGKLGCPVLMDKKRGRAVAKRSEVAVLGTSWIITRGKTGRTNRSDQPVTGSNVGA
jgi:predicted nucleic acid-binding protein